MIRQIAVLLFGFFPFAAFAQHPLLQSGPMIGYCEMSEVMLWVQTKSEAAVKFSYWQQGKPEQAQFTAEVRTAKDDGFTAHLVCDQVMQGQTYEFALWINGAQVKLPQPAQFKTQVLWQYRTDPPAFTFATGSCNFVAEIEMDRPGKPYGGDYGIFTSIHAAAPDFMLWLGDNVYLREPDWNTSTGIYHRYTHTRSLPELQPLLLQCPHYAIWDDHDYGPNDADRSFIHKDQTLAAFQDFWANPTCGLDGPGSGITTQFTWADCDFFLLDDRWFRAPNERVTGDRTQLGERQLEWLIDALRSSRAPFKFVVTGGQVLNTHSKFETYINYFPAERERLLKAIQDEKIKGVIFLTGDKHQTELSLLEPAGGVRVYDLTVSPLTSTAYEITPGANSLQVEGTGVGQRNFALLNVSGARNARKLTITVCDIAGQPVWKKEIAE